MASIGGLPQRRSVRLRDYDYSSVGAYFVTVCTARRECLFGSVTEGQVELSRYGALAQECWAQMPSHAEGVVVEALVVMPNHVHAVMVFDVPLRPGANAGARSFGRPCGRSLATLVGDTKSAAARRINAARGAPGAPVWQRGYYERVIRDEAEMDRACAYVLLNPARWDEDRYCANGR